MSVEFATTKCAAVTTVPGGAPPDYLCVSEYRPLHRAARLSKVPALVAVMIVVVVVLVALRRRRRPLPR